MQTAYAELTAYQLTYRRACVPYYESPIYEISHYAEQRRGEARRGGRRCCDTSNDARVSVCSPHICATHIRGSGQFSGLSLPVGRKTHLDPSWVTPLRPWLSSLGELTIIIHPSLSPSLASRLCPSRSRSRRPSLSRSSQLSISGSLTPIASLLKENSLVESTPRPLLGPSFLLWSRHLPRGLSHEKKWKQRKRGRRRSFLAVPAKAARVSSSVYGNKATRPTIRALFDPRFDG